MAITVAELVAKMTLDKGTFLRDIFAAEAELKNLAKAATDSENAVAKGLGGGLGKAVPALAVAGTAVAALTFALKETTQAAAQEDVNIGHLNAALRANIPFWNGNTDAIEETIAARQHLAYADDALRDSLAQLVTRTHDVNQALNLQNIAMDLARGRQIDLATASNIVGRVFSGNTAILTRYGIAVDKGATAQEALAKIQSTYAGQAEAYARTTVGSQQRVEIALANLSETIGHNFTPAVQAGQGAFADWIETIDRGVPRLVAAYKAYHDGVNEFLSTPVFGGRPQQQSTSELEGALDQFNAQKPALIQQGKDSGVAWTDSLVAAIGQGKIAVQDALKGHVSALDIQKAAQEIGGKVGQGYVLYTADGVAKFRPALKTEVGFSQDVLAQGLRSLQVYQGVLDKDTEAALAKIKQLEHDLNVGLGGLKAAADEARAWESIGQVGSPTGREALANAQRAANSAEGAKQAADTVAAAEKARKDAADAKAAADKAAYAQTPQGQVDAALDAARTQDAVDKLKAGNKAYIDALVQGEKDANAARDKLERAQKAAGLITETTAEREAKAAADRAKAAYAATPAGQLDSAIQAQKTEVEINRLKATNKQYIDAVVQGQLEANKARDALEIAQKKAGLIEYTTLEQEAKRKQADTISSLQSSLDFFKGVSELKTDVRGNVNLLFDNLTYTLKLFEQRAELWKDTATDRIKNIAGGVKSVSEALSAALNPLSLIADAGMVQPYEIDAAFANVEYALDKMDKLANSPRFQLANLQKLVDLSAGLSYAFEGIKSAVETVNSIGEQQSKVDTGELSYGIDQVYSAFAANGGGSGGGGTVNNYNWNGTIVATPEMRTLLEQFFQYLRDTGGGQMVGAGA